MRALVVLALLAARPAFACRCADRTKLERLAVNPELAETALLGAAEDSGSGSVFRVEASWTKYVGALVLPEATSCDLRPPRGERLILLSLRSADWFAEHKAAPGQCDSIMLQPAKEEQAVKRLAAKHNGKGPNPNPSWGYCRRDRDCTLAAAACGGGSDAIHGSYRPAHDAWVRRVAPTINCTGDVSVPGLKARCDRNFCVGYAPAP